MRKIRKYTDAPEDVRDALSGSAIIQDFLPPPEELVPREETQKVTIALSKKSIAFFKRASKKTAVPYQQIIRKVLDTYTEHYTK